MMKKIRANTHPSAERLFSKNNKLESIVKTNAKTFVQGHKVLVDDVKKSNAHWIKKAGTYSAIGFYDLVGASTILAGVAGYAGLNIASRIAETGVRTAVKLATLPGEIIEETKPNSWLGKFHAYASDKKNNLSDFVNKKKYLQISKDLAITGLSLATAYNVAAFDYSNKNIEINKEEKVIVKNIENFEDKKVFLYQQKLGNKYLKQEVLNTADYLMPHFWDMKSTKQKISKRRSEKNMGLYVERAHNNNVKVLPMFSSFKEKYINTILENPKYFAQKIVQGVQDIDADGITIDLESISIGNEKSEELVKFMKVLKDEFDKEELQLNREYEVAIATSPRFKNSSKKGYNHHGFYNYGKLDTIANVDWIHMMGYDFNVTKEGPGLPENKIKPIADYAIQNTKNNDKIVFCMPFYGRAFNKHGKTVGVLSEQNNHLYLNKKNASSKIKNGELFISTKNPTRNAYAQSPEIHQTRLDSLDNYKGKIRAVGGWRVNNASNKSLQVFQKWKQQAYKK